MLAVVKEPHIEMCLNGSEEAVNALMAVIRRSYEVSVIVEDGHVDDDDDEEYEEYVDIRETAWWKSMNTPGHLLAGARLKHDLTQQQLSEKSGISHATISAYEHDKRAISRRAAIRIARALGEDEETFYEKLTN